MTHTKARTLRRALMAAYEGTASDGTRPVLETVYVTIGASQAVFTGMDGWIIIQTRISIVDGPSTPMSAMLYRHDVAATIKRLRLQSSDPNVPFDVAAESWSCGYGKMNLADFAKRLDQREVFKLALASPQPAFKVVDPSLLARALKHAPSCVRLELRDMTLLVSGEEYRAIVMGMSGRATVNDLLAFTHLEVN